MFSSSDCGSKVRLYFYTRVTIKVHITFYFSYYLYSYHHVNMSQSSQYALLRVLTYHEEMIFLPRPEARALPPSPWVKIAWELNSVTWKEIFLELILLIELDTSWQCRRWMHGGKCTVIGPRLGLGFFLWILNIKIELRVEKKCITAFTFERVIYWALSRLIERLQAN